MNPAAADVRLKLHGLNFMGRVLRPAATARALPAMVSLGRSLSAAVFILGALLFSGCKTSGVSRPSQFSHFVSFDDFSGFLRTNDACGRLVLLSRVIKSPIAWNQLIVSWNATAPDGTCLKVEAAGIFPNRPTKFYTLGLWSPDGRIFPRSSVPGQRDTDGTVDTDTLVLHQPAPAAQLRVTLAGTNGAVPGLKFLGLSFSDTRAIPESCPPNRRAWGRTIATPQRSQHGYPGERGWCAPASLAMVLGRWANVLARPELDQTVPAVAAAVYDQAYQGTGNWPFNTALAGSFPGLRGCVTRFDDLAEVEDWIAAGIPVILSTRWDLLQPGRPLDAEGHLIVCVGFTSEGDVVANDPAARRDRGESVQRIYRRQNVVRAWAASHNTVCLVYPENARLPPDRFGHW